MHEIAVSSVTRRKTMVLDNWYTAKGAAERVKALRERLRKEGWTAAQSREECFSNGADVYMTESAWRALK